MTIRTVLALAATMALLALTGCKDKDSDDTGSASNAAPSSQVLPA